MHWLRIIAILLIAALLQAGLVPALKVRGAAPDLLLLIAAYIAVREPLEGRWRWNAFWVGWAAGLIEDLYSSGAFVPLGGTALVFGLVAVAISRLGADLFLDSAIAQILFLAPVALAAQIALAVMRVLYTPGPTPVMWAAVLGTACYTALVAPLAFAALRPLERFIGVRSRRSFWRA